MEKRYYTGVGSRETPPEILTLMTRVAYQLAKEGWVLRSGAADGADAAFERGALDAGGEVEIYLPWPGFNGHTSRLCRVTAPAREMAATVHPAWGYLKDSAKSLHARNCYQVLGAELNTPSEFLMCWTRDGCVTEATRNRNTGGTGTAIVLAERNGVPRFNLCRGGAMVHFKRFIREGVVPPYCQTQQDLLEDD